MSVSHKSFKHGSSIKEVVKDVQAATVNSDTVVVSVGKAAKHAHAIEAALVGRLSPDWDVRVRYSHGRSRVVITRRSGAGKAL